MRIVKPSKQKIKEIINYSYSPCYGTHGNQGSASGKCPICKQIIYKNKEAK